MMRVPLRKSFATTAVSVFLTLMVGCAATETTGDETDAADASDASDAADSSDAADASTAEPECEADSDCPDGTQRCDNGECVPKCEGVVCNEDIGEICDPTTGACVGGSDTCETSDDCSGGQICEEGLCVLSRLSDCTGGKACAAGLDCVEGPVSLCVAPCADHTACSIFEYCMTPDMVPIAPMAAFTNYCFPNLCNPGGDAFGVFQDTPYNGPCDVVEDGDGAGRCIGPIDENIQGICADFQGQLGIGESCDAAALQGSENTCLDSFCAEPVLGGTCSQLCNVTEGATCEAGTLGATSCLPSFTEGNGLCIPGLAMAEAGASCTADPATGLNSGGPACVDGYACVSTDPSSEDQVCVAWCNPNAAEGEANGCSETEICFTEGAPDGTGVCIPVASGGDGDAGEDAG
ncbi:MAG: hypothetical protein HOK28_19765 [Deltaproteobacteria bacterium]|nr:hypothetical protein [Deltaproteobacteria bacterium]